jgi:hypothetical protein
VLLEQKFFEETFRHLVFLLKQKSFEERFRHPLLLLEQKSFQEKFVHLINALNLVQFLVEARLHLLQRCRSFPQNFPLKPML